MTNKFPLLHLENTWLVRRSLKGADIDPFKSVMDIEDEDTANALAYKTGKRFDGNYIQERRNIETWLREEAESKGTSHTLDPPLYFRLYNHPLVFSTADWDTFGTPLNQVPADMLTFTIKDSFHNYARKMGRHTLDSLRYLEPRVFSTAELNDHIGEINAYTDHLKGTDPARYIEAQLWTRNPSVTGLAKIIKQPSTTQMNR